MQFNNKWTKWLLTGLAVLILGGGLIFFGNFFAQNAGHTEQSAPSGHTKNKKKGLQISASNGANYKTVINDGHYKVSKARGVTASKNGNEFNMVSFENGLLNFSKDHFSTDRYIFQEGQYLNSDTALDWLGRKSKDNPTGLNPADNGKTDSSRAPIYLQTLEEQDFMTQKGNDLSLAGVVVGLAMNTQDSYQKEKYGATYRQNISKQDYEREGRKIAQSVIERYRKLPGIKQNTPIIVAMYAQAPDDSLAGGNFYSWVQSTSGSQLSKWHAIDDQTVVLPMEEGTANDKSVANELNTSFKNFTKNVQNFFPNLSSVTGQAAYHDKQLAGLNVTVTTQFYSATEIRSFANYLAQVAPNYLPGGVPVQIRINAATGMQAYVTKSADSTKYSVTILGSY